MGKLLIYTCLFTEPGAESPDEPSTFEKVPDADYLCFTNRADLKTTWTVVPMAVPAGMHSKIFSRLVKFDPWTWVPELAKYDAALYMDVFLSLSTDPAWLPILRSVHANPKIDLLIQPNGFKSLDDEFSFILRRRLDSATNVAAQKKWLRERKMNLASTTIPRWGNKFFAFDPANGRVKIALQELAGVMQQQIAVRDQPFAAYVYAKHRLSTKPFYSPLPPGSAIPLLDFTGWRLRKYGRSVHEDRPSKR